jgi:antitoxin MazE9
MRLRVFLPDEDVEFLDNYAAAKGFASRSAVLHCAVALLRTADLESAYEEAFAEWHESGAAAEWEITAAD